MIAGYGRSPEGLFVYVKKFTDEYVGDIVTRDEENTRVGILILATPC